MISTFEVSVDSGAAASDSGQQRFTVEDRGTTVAGDPSEALDDFLHEPHSEYQDDLEYILREFYPGYPQVLHNNNDDN